METEVTTLTDAEADRTSPLYGVVSHVAITMDGNGRWARKQHKPRTFGHRKGAQVAFDIVKHAEKRGVEVVTLYAFSYENWQRSADEVGFLLEILLPETLKKASSYADDSNIRIRVIGDLEPLPTAARSQVEEAIERTAENTGMVLNFAVSYSGRREILRAVEQIVQDRLSGVLPGPVTDEDTFTSYLQTCGLPEPDLHIRCGGVNRLSNFMLWQMAYTELYAPDILWPDFTEADFDDAIRHFQKQPRKYGRVVED
ncbi:MAG: polyprenyl diphosphate synthase [Pseudomonadota bacterium]